MQGLDLGKPCNQSQTRSDADSDKAGANPKAAVDCLAKGGWIMDERNQRYDANGNDTNPLEDTERAGLKAHGVLHIEGSQVAGGCRYQ